MPIGEIAGELLGGIFRFFGYLIADIVFEFLLKGTGYFVCRPFYRKVNPDGALVIIVGAVFWVLFVYFAYHAYSLAAQQIAIDRCLDLGGKFNYAEGACEGSRRDR